MKEDILKRSGATLLTVEHSSPEKRESSSHDPAQVRAAFFHLLIVANTGSFKFPE